MTTFPSRPFLVAALIFVMTQFASAKGLFQSLNIHASPEQRELSENYKKIIWENYVKTNEGNWIQYSFVDTLTQKKVEYDQCKILAYDLYNFLAQNGIDEENLNLKYSPIAQVVLYKQPAQSINANFVSLGSIKAQYFYFRNDLGASCTTAAGNKICFPSNSFTCPSSGTIQLEVYEILSKKDLVKTGYTASSDDRMLQSQGMYKINASCGDKSTDLRKGASGSIKFLDDNFDDLESASTYNSFYGEPKDNVVNWKRELNDKVVKTNNKEKALPSQAGSAIKRTRIVSFTETTYVPLCRKIHLINPKIARSMEECVLNKRNYEKLVRAHGKLNEFKDSKFIEIDSYREYLKMAKNNPRKLLIALNASQKEDFDKNQKEENERIAAEEAERERIREEERIAEEKRQAELEAERLAALEQEAKKFPVVMKISKLGNINCDRFYDKKNKTDIIVNLDDWDYKEIRVYAVFKDIKSVINGKYRKEHPGIIKFEDLPVGENVLYLAATFKGSQVKLAYLDKSINEDDMIDLKLKAYPRAQYDKIMDDLLPNI